ncbi:hypothetical protein JCM21900_006855 [Sporobolomyces salmonicolor]
MSYHSPRPSHVALRPPPRPDTSPAVSPTSTSPHAFPPSDFPPGAPAPPPSSSTARFHEALAAYPNMTRHASQPSVSSVDSLRGFDSLDAASSPMGDRAFDAMQRELGGAAGTQGLGLLEASTSRGPSPNYAREMGRLYEEPEEYHDTARAMSSGRDTDVRGRNGGFGGHEIGEDGVGRPASIDLDNAMSFLLSPPPSFDVPTASAKQFAAAAASDAPRGQSRGGRVFPAPLLLKGGSNPSSPIFPQTAPLSIPRRPSASSGGSNGSPSPGQGMGRSWSAVRERDGPIGPPASAGESSRSQLPYQRHRPQQSSTSSLSQGSYLPYNNSYLYEPRHQASASTSTVSTASPAVGSRSNPQAFPSSSSIGPAPVMSAAMSAPVASSTSTASSSPEPPISAQALLLHVLALRSASSPMSLSQSQGPLSRSGTPLLPQPSHQRIRSAGSATGAEGEPSPASIERSPRPAYTGAPRLDTVDLSHRRIAEVPLEVVEELKDEVEKLALGYNLLRDLPPYFMGLGNRLKYLNVRVNMLTTFPAVLCEMPSIEILDISRNKIRKLPQNPGTLLNLKVFSIAKNRIKRLPTWFTAMSHLKVLKLDHNPLDWPPKEVSTFQTAGSISGAPMTKQEEADEMQRWLPALIRWMRENREKEVEREREREREKRRRPSMTVEHLSEDERPSQASDDFARPIGMPRTESGRLRTSPSLPSIEVFPRPRAGTFTRTGTDFTSVIGSNGDFDNDASARHSRNASHSITQSLEPGPRPGLRAKKSLPDLRQSHAEILAERRTGTTIEEEPPRPRMPVLDGPLRRLREERPGLFHSTSARAALPTQASTSKPLVMPSPGPPESHILVRSQSACPLPPASAAASSSPLSRQDTAPLPRTGTKADFDARGQPKRADVDRSAATFDRNSGAYFRRMSMLPASTIAKTVPVALLQFADTIRGILFSLSQIYSALRQFVVFASQDRLPAMVARLMGSADQATNSLINALDRFDSLSRRGTPPQHIIRDIFTTCRDNVSTFGKLVAALQPQLKVLTGSADVRYTRTLLLMLYGSMGEIANSWSAVAPLFADADDPASAMLVLQPPTPSPMLEMSTASSSTGGVRLQRTRSTTRRHAGSFSVEDVQLGAVLPPADIPPVPAIPASTSLDENGFSEFNGGTVRARPTLSAKSFVSSAFGSPNELAMPPTMHYQDMVQKAFEQPLTPGGTGLFERSPAVGLSSRSGSFSVANPPVLSTSASFPSTSLNGTAPPPSSYNPHRESRPVSTLNADETFVDQADSTIQIAFDVYQMLADSVDDPNSPSSAGAIGKKRARELMELCKAGNDTTARLKRAVERVRGGDGRGRLKFTSSDARRLGDSSFDFVQTVIKFARAVKTTSTEVSFSPQVREGVGQLTLATREFAKLLSQNQTSFRPSQQPIAPQPQPSSRGGSGGGEREAREGGFGGEVKSRDYAM